MPSLDHIVTAISPEATAASALRVATLLAESTGARLTQYSLANLVPAGGQLAGIEIPRFAERVGAGLIVLPRLKLGGDPLADAVTRRSHVPCLTVPSEHEDLGRWLIALDGSPRCQAALAALVQPLLKALGGTATTLQVREGDVFEGILRTRSAEGAGVLALCSRPGGPPPPIPSGSLARRLVSEAACMVLTVPI